MEQSHTNLPSSRYIFHDKHPLALRHLLTNYFLKSEIMKRVTPLEASIHKQTFSSTGTYSIEQNSIELATEIPMVTLSHSGKNHSLGLKGCIDISSKRVPCMLSIYAHGHPTDRRKLPAENLVWDKKSLSLNSIFDDTNFPENKILVISVHDEDFEDWHSHIYRFFVQHHVSFNGTLQEYDCDIKSLQEFINGKFIDFASEEEPRTVGGGVLDPA